ncbi:MAG: T9SS type A sorting domain-containing protein [Bacteroidia bacterium]
MSAQIPYGHEKAIYKDSSIFVAWATGCSVQRGLQNIADSSNGFATAGDPTDATGKADGITVVSLGDGGSAVLTFDKPIFNGNGSDFAVFENGFPFGNDSTFFLELGFVEVSSDGINYFRFPSASLTDTLVQIGNGDGIDPNALRNLAGKYMVNYGTPFDLEELKNSPGLDVNHITHVKIIDVVGSLVNSFARRDSANRKINDPWPTPFASCGFDLDAVGVIHQFDPGGIDEINTAGNSWKVYPQPAKRNEIFFIETGTEKTESVELFNFCGELMQAQLSTGNVLTFDPGNVEQGIYFLRIKTGSSVLVKKLLVN